MVFAGDDGVFGPGVTGGVGPRDGVVQVRVEVIEVPLIVGVGDVFKFLDPLVAGCGGVDAPVDKQTEPVVDEPVGSIRGLLWLLCSHLLLLFQKERKEYCEGHPHTPGKGAAPLCTPPEEQVTLMT